MAIRMIDGFEVSYAAEKWSTSRFMSASTGRFTDGVTLSSSARTQGNDYGLGKTLLSSETGVNVFGFAYWPGTNLDRSTIFTLFDATTLQVLLRSNSDGSLSVVRGDGTVLGTSSASLITSGTWCYIEWKIKVANSISSGECVVKLTTTSGTTPATIINLAAASDTQNTANPGFNAFCIGNAINNFQAGSGNGGLFDDFYWLDTTGSTSNDFLGEQRVYTVFPNGNGSTSNFVGNDGNSTDNYLLIDETSANSDTDYVESSTVGDTDTYNFQDLPTTVNSITAVQTSMYCKKTDAGTRQLGAVTRISGTDYVNATAVNLDGSYAYKLSVWDRKPSDSTTWSRADFNSAEFGMKVVA